jgi:hypothetical protein
VPKEIIEIRYNHYQTKRRSKLNRCGQWLFRAIRKDCYRDGVVGRAKTIKGFQCRRNPIELKVEALLTQVILRQTSPDLKQQAPLDKHISAFEHAAQWKPWRRN